MPCSAWNHFLIIKLIYLVTEMHTRMQKRTELVRKRRHCKERLTLMHIQKTEIYIWWLSTRWCSSYLRLRHSDTWMQTNRNKNTNWLLLSEWFQQCRENWNIGKNLSDHYWVKLKFVTGTEIEIGPGNWRLNNNVLIPNYELIRNFLCMSDVNRKNYDMEKQKLRDYLRGLCLKKKSLENQRKQKITEFLSNCDPADPNYGFYSKVLRGIEIKEFKELLSKTKNHMKKVFEGNPKSVKRWVESFQPRTLINELKCSNGEMFTS